MKIIAIDHVQLAMPPGEEEAARRFYRDVLGFVEIPKPASLAGRGGVWFRQGAVTLHLGTETNFRPARKAHPALLVEGLDELTLRVRESGCEVDESQPPLEGYRRAHIFDPFGNRIECLEKTT
jgi:catechol 2,3-dioxygenase-like lactoylglutathione lyase family enzyme